MDCFAEPVIEPPVGLAKRKWDIDVLQIQFSNSREDTTPHSRGAKGVRVLPTSRPLQ